MTDDFFNAPVEPKREPIFNIPAIIVVFCLVLIAIHLARVYVFGTQTNVFVILNFAFIPAFYGAPEGALPISAGAYFWSPFTYSLLHGDWMHLALNVFWILAFGTPVARRLGWARFALLSLAASLGGALAHFIFHIYEFVPVIGASAIVSGYMGAASRFVFGSAAFIAGQGFRHDGPSQTLVGSLTNPAALAFIGVWMGMNLLFGLGTLALPGKSAGIAWQAHIGGFLVGLFGFFLFDPKQNHSKT